VAGQLPGLGAGCGKKHPGPLMSSSHNRPPPVPHPLPRGARRPIFSLPPAVPPPPPQMQPQIPRPPPPTRHPRSLPHQPCPVFPTHLPLLLHPPLLPPPAGRPRPSGPFFSTQFHASPPLPGHPGRKKPSVGGLTSGWRRGVTVIKINPSFICGRPPSSRSPPKR